MDLDVAAGEVTLLMGPSGSGKTTLVSIMGCILRPSSGSVRVLGREITTLPSNATLETAGQRRKAADSGAQAAADKLASESRLFASGESTNFLVLTRQTDYAVARRRQVEGESAFNQAVTQYEAATGTVLSARRISVE